MIIRPPRYLPIPPNLQQGLVGWWPMDDFTGTSLAGDASGLGGVARPNGSINVGAGFNQLTPFFGKPTKGALRPANNTTTNFLNVPLVGRFGITAASLFAWVKINSTPPVGAVYGIISNRDSLTAALYILSVNNLLAVEADFQATTTFSNSGGTLALNTWSHVGWTYSSAVGLTIYQNGVSQATVAANGAMLAVTSSTSGVAIGSDADSGSLNRAFDGWISDAALWNRAITPGEVLALYSMAFQPRLDIETIALMRKPAVVAGGAKFRRTLSPMGTHTGGRQRQGWAA